MALVAELTGRSQGAEVSVQQSHQPEGAAVKSVLLFAAIVAFTPTLCMSAEVRTWKARTGGTSIEAEFVSLAEGKVTLKRAGGKLTVVALEKLSDEDQEFVAQATAKPAAGAASATTSKGAAATGPLTIGDTTIEIMRLEIARPAPPAAEPKEQDGFSNMGMPMGNEGTSIHLLAANPKALVIGMSGKKSRIASLMDDKQTNLLKAGKQDDRFGGGMFGPLQAHVAPGGRRCALEIKAPKIPARGATKLQLDATVVLLCGADERTVEQKGLNLKKGTKLTIGPVPLTLGQIEDARFGEAKQMVTFESKQPLSAIKKVEFLSADGKPIKHQSMGSGEGGFNDNITYSVSYGLMQKVDSVTVKLTYFDKIEELTLPLKIDIGLGL